MKNMTALSGLQRKWFTVLAGMFCLTMAAGALAEAMPNPCAADADKLCQGVKKGGGAQAKCLKKHQSELSLECQNKVMEAERNLKHACTTDAKKFCKGVKPGQGKVVACLKEHESDLSASCKKVLEHPKSKM